MIYKEIIMNNKPRNYVALALLKRGCGAGTHVRSNKAQRQKAQQNLRRELKQAKSETF